MSSFDLDDLFPGQSNEPVKPSESFDFRNSHKGYVFEAGGRSWRIIRDNIGHAQKLVVDVADPGGDSGGTAFFAEMKDDTILVSKLSKHGEYRPIGKPIAKKRVTT